MGRGEVAATEQQLAEEESRSNAGPSLQLVKASGCFERLRSWRKRVKAAADWRRVAHAAKVGLALALVSLSVLLQDVFDKLGPNALWAILTVVVIFEYTVGATLSKGLNRGLGTIMAASLGLSVDYMANYTGASVEPFVVGFSVFVVGMTATYTRSVPSIKAKYDYGVVIFLLTFCLVVISGYKVSDNIDVVFDRIVTVMVGVIICLLVSIFIFPIWAGDDLQDLVTKNFEGLANSLEECLKEYFGGVRKACGVPSKICKGQPYDDKIYKGYRGVLISKQTEESLAIFAGWELRRGRFGCIYPWKALVELGAVLRHCAYAVSALHGCVLSEIQAPESWRKVFASACMEVGKEVAGVLRSVAASMRSKRTSPPKLTLLHPLHRAVEALHSVARIHPQFLVATSFHLHSNPNPNPTPPKFSPRSPPINLSASSSPFSDFNNSILHQPFPSPNLSPNLFPNANPNSARSDIEAPKATFTDLSNGDMAATPTLMAPECMAFAETLSLACLIALLIEIVARVEHLIDANAEFQEEAGFRQASPDDDDGGLASYTSLDIKDSNGDGVNRILNQPLSTSHVE
ncbi:hypothetical protein GOP47_0028960 [Adiantum capillus-veneris]|nr:hypothetical protein GOP47_0028960 [Adiantum capillus-veneris]